MAEEANIIVAGAGPAGLTAALVLAAAGVPVRVLEAEAGLAIDLRAGSYHPPTLEMLAPYGITDRMIARGVMVPYWHIRDRNEGLLAEFDLGLLKDDTPYPYRLHLEQHKLTPMLLEAAKAFPHFDIRFDSKLVAARQDEDGVSVTTDGPGGREDHTGSYLIGADGHHSVVRGAIAAEFEGFTWPELFLVLSTPYDFEAHGYARATYIADPVEWVMLFKVPGFEPPALWRMALPTDPDLAPEIATSDETVQDRLAGFLADGAPYEVVDRNLYRVHQRVAKHFTKGRMAIVGDAAHVNNPLGAMGLNGAVHDAVNLAEKLIALWRGEAGREILQLYERQRRPVQIDFVQRITIRNKRLVEERDPKVRRERQDEIRALAADKEKQYEFLLDTSMISMVRKAAAVT